MRSRTHGAQLHGLDVVTLRASNPHGRRWGNAGMEGIIGTSLRKVVRSNKIEVCDDGRVIRDFANMPAITTEPQIKGCFSAGPDKGASGARIICRALSPLYRPGRGFDGPRIGNACGVEPTMPPEQNMWDCEDWICQQQVSAVVWAAACWPAPRSTL